MFGGLLGFGQPDRVSLKQSNAIRKLDLDRHRPGGRMTVSRFMLTLANVNINAQHAIS